MSGKHQFNMTLHGLRGLASLLVFCFHIWSGAIQAHFLPLEIPDALRYGLLSLQFGVELFFMISGNLVTASIVRHADAVEFLKDRAIRIYPAFLPIILVIFIVGPAVGYSYFAGVGAWEWVALLVANIVFLPGVLPMESALLVAWSLSYEAMFYLTGAATDLAYRRSKRMGLTLGLFLAVVICCYFPRSVFFLAGVLVYFYEPRMRSVAEFVGKLALPAFVLFFAALLFLVEPKYGPYGLAIRGALSLVALMGGLVVFLSVVFGTGPLSRLLRTKPFLWLGSISYSLYLWHTLVMFSTKRVALKVLGSYGLDGVFVGFTILSGVASLVLAFASFKLLEERLPRLLTKRSAHVVRATERLHLLPEMPDADVGDHRSVVEKAGP